MILLMHGISLKIRLDSNGSSFGGAMMTGLLNLLVAESIKTTNRQDIAGVLIQLTSETVSSLQSNFTKQVGYLSESVGS